MSRSPLHALTAVMALTIFSAFSAARAQPLEKYALHPEEIVGIVKKHFRDRTGITLNFDRTELVATHGKEKAFRETVSPEDARCFQAIAIALESAILQKSAFIELIRNIAPSVTIGARDNTAHAVPDESLAASMKPSTFADSGEIPVNTVRIQPLITASGCVTITSADFAGQLQEWVDQVHPEQPPGDEGKRKPATRKKHPPSR